jgi:hypothetical protein
VSVPVTKAAVTAVSVVERRRPAGSSSAALLIAHMEPERDRPAVSPAAAATAGAAATSNPIATSAITTTSAAAIGRRVRLLTGRPKFNKC